MLPSVAATAAPAAADSTPDTQRQLLTSVHSHTHMIRCLSHLYLSPALQRGVCLSLYPSPDVSMALVSLCRWFLTSGDRPIGARALTNTKTLVKLTEAYIKLVWELVVDRYIGRYLVFFQYRHWPISFSVWPMCSRWDFYFDGAENGSAWPHNAHILPLVYCRR